MAKFGAALGGVAWTVAGWPACAAMIVGMLAIMLTIVTLAWSRTSGPTLSSPIEPAE